MSKLDIINQEITRRKDNITALEQAEQDLIAAIEQFNKLDELYKTDEKTSREALECLYRENRHFSGKQPIVYTSQQVEKRPFFGGAADTDCNPYYPITKVQDKTFDGISPLFAAPTKTGAFQRDASFSPTEEVARQPALTALQAFPDISNEPLPPSWPNAPAIISSSQCYYAAGGDQITCEANGGIWGVMGNLEPDPIWVGSETAPALLRVPLTAWRDDMILIRDDVCNSAGEVSYWQGLIDDCNTVLAAIASDAVFVRATGNSDPAAWGQTQDFTPASPEDLARDRLITAADTGVLAHVTDRKAFLESEANTEEQVFFGIVKLRIHQANGSYAKLMAAKDQIGTSAAIISDHKEALKLLNILKVKNS